MLGFSSDFITTENYKFVAVEIPDGYIIEKEIVKAVNGKDFFYNDNETGKPVYVSGIKFEDFYYYYIIWEDWHVIGQLPHGKGTLSERRWLLDLLKIFEKANMQVENLMQEIAHRNNNG